MAIAISRHWRVVFSALVTVTLLGIGGYALAGGSDDKSGREDFDAAWANANAAAAIANVQLAQADASVERPPSRSRGSTTLPAGASNGNQAVPLPPGSNALPARPNPNDPDATRRFRERIEAQRREAGAHRRPGSSPLTAPNASAASQPDEMRRDSNQLPEVSDEELKQLQDRIRSGQPAEASTPVPPPPSEPGRAVQSPSSQPSSMSPRRPYVAPPTSQPSNMPPRRHGSSPLTGGRTATPGVATPGAGSPPPGTPAATGTGTPMPPPSGDKYEVRMNEQTKGPELVRPKEFFRIPVEERKFFYVWKNTPMQKTFEDVAEMSGLSPIGQIDQPDQQLPVTFESDQMQDFNDALTTFNQLIMEKGYWVLRMDHFIGIRRLTDWYRFIPPARIYDTVEDFGKAKLPGWELASVRYEPKYMSPSMLAALLVDNVPDNTARATLIPDSNKIELKGFVEYINKQLEYARIFDRESSDGRKWKAYPLKYAAPSVAVEMLAELMPPESGGAASVVRNPSSPTPAPAVPRRGSSPMQAPQPAAAAADIGASTSDQVEIREDKRKNQILVRASEAKHKLVEQYMKEFIDVPLDRGERREVIKLENAEPNDLVEKIRPLLGRRELFQPPAPPPRQGPGGQPVEQPAPPPTFRNIGSTAEMVAMENSQSILVKATEDEMATIKEYIAMLDLPSPNDKLQYVELKHGSASNIASMLSVVFGSRPSRPGSRSSSEGLKVVADNATDRALLIGGEKKDMEEAKDLIAKLDVDPEAGAVEHVVILQNATPSALAETLSARFGGQTSGGGGDGGYYGGRRRGYGGGGGGEAGQLPRFLSDDAAKMLIVMSREEMWPDIDRLIKQVDDQSKTATLTRTYRIKHADAAMLTSILSEALSGHSGGGRRGYYGAPSDPNTPMFAYEPQSNAVVVTAMEEIHGKAKALIEELDQPSPAEKAGWRVIHLEKADVDYVESTLDDVFRQGGSRRRSGYSYGGGYGSDSSGSANKVPVRIIAETVSNSLLVSASDEDFAKVEELAKKMDADYAAKEMIRKTFELKFADPSEVSEIIQTTFEARSSSGHSRGGYGYYGGGMSSEGPNLGVKVAEIGRGLIVQAPKDKMEEIGKLIAEVDTDATAGNEIKTYKVKGGDYRGTYELANNLRELFTSDSGAARRGGGGGSSNVKFIGEYGSDLLMVSAPASRMPDIDKRVKEMIEAKQGADTTMVIRHFDIQRARPQELVDIIEPVLETKYQEMQQQSGGGMRFFGFGGSGGPRVTAHKSDNRIMVSAPESLMKTVEELIGEFDKPSRPSTTRIITLMTAKAEDIAPIVEEQITQGGGGGSSRRSSHGGSGGYGGWFDRWSSSSHRPSGSTESNELSVTAVESSNSIILTGMEQKVAEGEALIKKLDEGARPEGMFKVIKIVKADLLEVADMVEEMVAGGSSSSSDYGSGFSRRASMSSHGSGQITVRTDYQTNQLLVFAPPEKFPIIEQIVAQMEAMAEEASKGEAGKNGEVIARGKNQVTKLYKVKDGMAEEVADVLDKALYDLLSWDAPYVKPFSFTNEIIVEGEPKQFAQVEKLLEQIQEHPPKPKMTMVARRVKDPERVLSQLGGYANIAQVRRTGGPSAVQRIRDREIFIDTPFDEPPAQSINKAVPAAANPFVPAAGELAQMKAALRELSLGPVATSQPTTSTGGQAASGTKPSTGGQAASGTKPSTGGQAASGTKPANAPATQPAAAKPTPAQPAPAQPTAAKPASQSAAQYLLEGFKAEAATRPAGTGGQAASGTKQSTGGQAASGTKTSAPAQAVGSAKPSNGGQVASAAKAPATQPVAAKPSAAPQQPVVAKPVEKPAAPVAKASEKPAAPKPSASPVTVAQKPTTRPESPQDALMNELTDAAGKAQNEGEVQVRYDPEQGLIFIVGQESKVKDFDSLLDTIAKELEDVQTVAKTEFRVFRVEHVAVEVAAVILEQMFNDTVPAQPGKNPQKAQAAKKPAAKPGDQAKGEGDEEGGGSRRREEEESKKQEEAQAQAAAAAASRIKVIPDPRTNTLIVRSSPDTFPAIAELLLKIDRPGGGAGVKIKLFQLKKLNAGDVEEAIKAILKIDDGRTRALRNRSGLGGLGGMRGGLNRGGGAEADLIDRLQEQMLELQMQQQQDAAVEAAEAATSAKTGQGASGAAATAGKLKLNPAKDIMITSDATTNTIIVAAPDEGIKLVESLINQLEEQEIPLEIKTFQVQNADAEKVAGELEKVFGPDRSGGGGRRGVDGLVPGRVGGDIKIAADSRASTIIVRALKPDMDKIEPMIKAIDVPPKEQQVQIYPVKAGTATEMAATLTKIFTEPGETGSRAVRIQADADTNSLLVYAPTEAKQLLISSKIKELDEKMGEQQTAKQIELKIANATSVAKKLEEIFVPAGGKRVKGAQRIDITGDDNSGILFVVAPEEIFKQIQKVAMDLDRPSKQDVQVFALKHAIATDVETQFKALMQQMAVQLRGSGAAETFGVTPDPRTNSLVVVGSPTTMMMVDTVLKKLDVPPSDNTAETVAMYPITGGGAATVAASINALYAGTTFPGGVKPPRAVPSGTDMVYVYGTGQQIQQIKAMIIDPLEAYRKPLIAAVKDFQLDVKFIKADEAAKKVQEWFKSRNAALTAAGSSPPPSETVMEITSDPMAKRLFVHSSETNKKQVEELLKIVDTAEASDAGLKFEVLPVKYTDVTYAYQAISSVFGKSDRPVNERPVITYEYGSRSLVVKAMPEDLTKIKELLAQIDNDKAGKALPPQTIVADKVKATELVSQITTYITQTKKRDARTGLFPVTVSGNDSNNTVVITAQQQSDLDEIMGLIKQLDSRPAGGDQREVRAYVLKYADLGASIQAITANFAGNANRPIKDQVNAQADYTTSSLLVTASAENHGQVGKIIAELDQANIGTAKVPETIQVQNVKASELANNLTNMIRLTKKLDRRTGQYPVTVTANDTGNVLLVTANAEDMEEMRKLVAKLDSRPAGDQREVRAYVLKYADLGASIQAITANFAGNTNRPIKDQVTAQADYTTSSLLVTASAENHSQVTKIIEQLDKSNILDTLPKPEAVPVKNVRATQMAAQLTQMIPTMYRLDKRTSRYPVSVTGDDSSNTLLVTAKPDEMARMKELITSLDLPAGADDRPVKPYVVQYADLTAVYQTILGRFPANPNKTNRDQVTVNLDYTNSTVIVTASPENHAIVEELVKGLDRLDNIGHKETKTIVLSKARATDLAQTLTATIRASAPQRRTPAPTVQANDATNTLLVTATEKEFNDIQELVKILDIEPSADSERTLKVYSLKYADMYSLINAVTSSFKGIGTKKISDTVDAVPEAGTYSLIVMANAENHAKVAKLIEDLDKPGTGTRQTFTLEIKYADPEDIVQSLTNIYSNAMDRTRRDSRVPALFNVLQGTRKVLVTTTPSELEEIKVLIAQLDVEESTKSRDMRVVSVQRIAPQEMAQMLTEYLRKPGKSGRYDSSLLGDVRIIPSAGANAVVLTGPTDRLTELEQLIAKVDATKGKDDDKTGRQVAVIPLVNADPSSVASLITSSFGKRGQVAEAELVEAGAERTTNTVVVTAMPDKLEKVKEMIKNLDENSSNTPKQQIVALKHARAQDLVDVLTQTYRSSRRASGGPQIAFAPDTNGNSVVVSAGEADLAAIKDMIEQLDKPATDQVQEMRVMPLEFIDATETEKLLTEHFKKPAGSGRRGSSGDLIGDIRIQASAVMNALIVSGSSAELDKIQTMIQSMDKEVAGAAGAPRIIKLQNAMPSQLAQTLTQMFTDPAKQSRGRTSPDTVPLIVADETSSSLLVRARNVDYNLIEDMVKKLDVAPDLSGMKVIRVSRGVDVANLSKTIESTVNNGELYKQQQQKSYKAGRVSIGFDERVPALIVAGTPELFKQVDSLVTELDGMKPTALPRTIIIPVGDPAGMKRVLDQVIQQHTGTKQKQ